MASQTKALAYLENNSRIPLVFLTAYAPTLNLIERLWKLFKKKTLYGRYYETFYAFRKTCKSRKASANCCAASR